MTITVYNGRDVAALLRVTPAAVGNYQARHSDTPKPAYRTRSGIPLWDEAGLREWLSWQENRGDDASFTDIDQLRDKLSKPLT